MPLSISLIIPTNRVDVHLEQCLERIGHCTPPPQEVIVVIDGDRGQVLPDMEHVNLKTIRLPISGGPGRARNIGAGEAVGDLLLFIDADVIVPENICSRMADAFSREPSPDAVFGSYDANPGAQDTVSQYKNLLHHYTHQHSNSEAFTFWTGCGAILRSRFIELNGFNENYDQPSVEDIELGYRLKQAGGTILLDKRIQVTHLKKWSLVNMIRTDFFHRAIPWSRVVFQYGSMHNDMNIDLNSRISVALTFLMLLCFLLTQVSSVFFLSTLLLFVLLLFLNRGLFLFFLKKRGMFFLLKILPLHLLYFFLSGIAFCLVFLQHLFGKSKKMHSSPLA
jgi:glycosyltransferase involved in cell wall biosynthesis